MAQSDPLAILPPELILHILYFLKPTQSWAVRRVSKSWNEFMQSRRIIEDVLRSAETHDPQDGLPGDLDRRVEVYKSQSTGPAGHTTYNLALTSSTLAQYRWPTLKGEYLAYIHEEDSVRIIHLVNRKASIIKACGKILKLALTSWMVIYTLKDSVNWHALDGSARGKHTIRATAIAGHGDHMVASSQGRLLVYNQDGLFSTIDIAPTDEVTLLLRPGLCLVASTGWAEVARVELDGYMYKSVEWVKIDCDWHYVQSQHTSWLTDGADGYYLTCHSRGGRMYFGRLRHTWESIPFGMTSARWKDRLYDNCQHLGQYVIVWADNYVMRRATYPGRGHMRYEWMELLINDNFLIIFTDIDTPLEVFTFYKAGRSVKRVATFDLNKMRNWSWIQTSYDHPDLKAVKERMSPNGPMSEEEYAA